MKTAGLIGGMSWHSTVSYYKILNEVIQKQLGGLHSAQCLLYSVDFEEIEENMTRGDWEKCAEILAGAAMRLEKAGADFIVICTNTMHKVAPQIEPEISIPILHIADATANELKKHNIGKAALLGTKYCMTQPFYTSRLKKNGVEVLLPTKEEIEYIHAVIFDELCLGILSAASKKEFLRIIDALAQRGAGGVILGCTEISSLVKQTDTAIPLFDTTSIHATAAALFALGK